MTHSRLVRLFDECGQSPWLDNLKREYITSGSLQGILDTGIRGLTSNPTIFQKAIQGSQDYDEQFRQLAALKRSPIESYWELVIKDIQDALDVFRPLYESSNHSDGFVSVEVDPNLAHDSAATEKAARELDVRVDRDNVMIKIPATRSISGSDERLYRWSRDFEQQISRISCWSIERCKFLHFEG